MRSNLNFNPRDNFGNISSFIKIIKNKQFDKLINIDGIGETQLNSLKNFFSDQLNVRIVTELQNVMHIESQSLVKDGVLKNKSFMFTGKLEGISRAEAKSLVEKNSGITLSNVGKNLNYLVIGSKPTKRKVDKAKTLGVNIISLEDLKKLLN